MASGPSSERGGGIAFDENVSSFTVRVIRDSEKTAPSLDSQTDLRKLFWSGFAYQGRFASADGAAEPRLFELQLRSNFDRAMTRQAFDFRRAHAAGVGDLSNAPPPASFAFRVGELRYSSLEFTVGIVGLHALYKYFFSDPTLVLAFLELCSPPAFTEALWPIAGQVPSDLTFAVAPALGLGAALSTLGAQGQGPGTTTLGATPATPGWPAVLQKAQTFWWLLPTVLALIVLYIAISAVHSERDRQQARQAALDARANQLDGALKERVKALEALPLELIKQLKEVPAKEPCCPACCVAKTCVNPAARPASKPAAASCKS